MDNSSVASLHSYSQLQTSLPKLKLNFKPITMSGDNTTSIVLILYLILSSICSFVLLILLARYLYQKMGGDQPKTRVEAREISNNQLEILIQEVRWILSDLLLLLTNTETILFKDTRLRRNLNFRISTFRKRNPEKTKRYSCYSSIAQTDLACGGLVERGRGRIFSPRPEARNQDEYIINMEENAHEIEQGEASETYLMSDFEKEKQELRDFSKDFFIPPKYNTSRENMTTEL